MTGIDSVISQSAGWGAVAVCAYLLLGLLSTLAAESVSAAGRCAAIALSLYPRVARSALRTVVAALVGVAGTLGAAAGPQAGGARRARRGGPPPSPRSARGCAGHAARGSTRLAGVHVPRACTVRADSSHAACD